MSTASVAVVEKSVPQTMGRSVLLFLPFICSVFVEMARLRQGVIATLRQPSRCDRDTACAALLRYRSCLVRGRNWLSLAASSSPSLLATNRREAKHQKLRMPRLPMMKIHAIASDVLAAHVAACVHYLK